MRLPTVANAMRLVVLDWIPSENLTAGLAMVNCGFSLRIVAVIFFAPSTIVSPTLLFRFIRNLC
jgi:hypothetical protein